MRIPFHRPVSTELETAPLTRGSRRAGRTTDIPNPDTRYPAEHAVNTVEPHANAEAFRRAVRDAVAAHAAAGALDENNLEALSEQILSWMQTWVSLVRRTSAQRREVAEALLAQNIQSEADVAGDLDVLRRSQAENRAARRALLVRLGFAEDLLDARPEPRAERPRTPSRVRALRASAGGDAAVGDDAATAPNEPLPFPSAPPLVPIATTPAGFSASAEHPTS